MPPAYNGLLYPQSPFFSSYFTIVLYPIFCETFAEKLENLQAWRQGYPNFIFEFLHFQLCFEEYNFQIDAISRKTPECHIAAGCPNFLPILVTIAGVR